jgi:hypothetical protein
MQVGLAEHTFDGGQQPAGQAVTDESGTFEIDGVPPGEYGLGAQNYSIGYPGKLPFQQISIVASGPCTTITYNAGARTAKLKFTVTDALTNKLISDVVVDVAPAGQRVLAISRRYARAPDPQVPSLAKLILRLRLEVILRRS